MIVHPLQAHNNAKYDNNEESWYFRFQDNNTMSYKYIFLIT